MRLLSPVIAFCLLAATTLSGCGAAKKQAEKPPEPCTVQNYSPAEIFKQASPSIVVIKAGDSQGSGFVVKQDKRYTYILTNSHVVAGANEVSIKWADDREEKAKVIADHGGEPLQKDLALLQVDAIRGKPLALNEKAPAIGADVLVIGAPQGLEFSLSRGVLSQLRENGDFLQIDAAVNPGNSGGPLFDKAGCVIGVVTFKAEQSEGLNFAIGHEPVHHFLENPAIERPAQAKQADKAEKIKVVYEPPIIDFPASLSIPKPSGAGWTFSRAYCSPWGDDDEHRAKDMCIGPDDTHSELTKKIVNSVKPGGYRNIAFHWKRYDGRRGNYAHYTWQNSARSWRWKMKKNSSGRWVPDGSGEVIIDNHARATGRHRDVVDCERWLSGGLKNMDMSPIVPGSWGESIAEEACKKGMLVEIASPSATLESSGSENIPASPDKVTCDDKVDAIFYDKYPSMRGQKITDPNSEHAKDWSRIKSVICNPA